MDKEMEKMKKKMMPKGKHMMPDGKMMMDEEMEKKPMRKMKTKGGYNRMQR